MNDFKRLLVLKTAQHLSKAQIESLTDLITPTAEALDAEPMVLGSGFDVELHNGSSALLERVCVALEEIAAQGRAPEVSDAQIAPQSLNSRPTGLNSRAHTPPVRSPADPKILGMAYPGVDVIPKEGTYPLEKGERVSTGLNSRTPNYQPPTEPYGSTGSNEIIKKGR